LGLIIIHALIVWVYWASNGSYDGIFWCWKSAIIIPYI